MQTCIKPVFPAVKPNYYFTKKSAVTYLTTSYFITQLPACNKALSSQ